MAKSATPKSQGSDLNNPEDDELPMKGREIDKSTESFYSFHIYTTNGVSLYDKNIMTQRCIELILHHRGEIREDWRKATGQVFYTMPPGISNPVREDDPMFRGKMVTRHWTSYTQKERELFDIKDH